MRFFEVLLSGAALMAAALAVELNDVPSSITPGKTYTITYSPKDQTPTTLILRKGLSTDLGTVATITTTATGGSFQWTVPNNLVNGNDYALEIVQAGAAPNYSGQFPLTGSTASAAVSSYAVTSATASATVSSVAVTTSTTKVSTTVTTLSTVTASASGSLVPSAGANSTVTSATLSGSASSSSAPTSTASGGPPETTGAASMLGSSPMALLFGAVAAMAYLN